MSKYKKIRIVTQVLWVLVGVVLLIVVFTIGARHESARPMIDIFVAVYIIGGFVFDIVLYVFMKKERKEDKQAQ